MTKYRMLESQISFVMESLTRAAVDEICKLVDTECVEMRLEIQRRESEIESLKKEIRYLKKEFRHDSPASVPSHADDTHVGEDERDMKTGDVYHETDHPEEVEDEKMKIVTKNLEENENEGSTESGLECSKSQILSDLFSTEDIADIGGLCPAALKVECGNQPLSTGEGALKVCQEDQKLPTDIEGHMIGDIKNQFGSTDDFQPQSHYSVQSHHGQLSEEGSHCTFDTQFSPLHEQWRSEDNLSGMKFKTEQEEVPLGQRTNESPTHHIMENNAFHCPSMPAVNCDISGRNTDCTSRLWQNLPSSHSDPQIFHLDGTSEILTSQGIKYIPEPQTKQARARKNLDRIQSGTFKHNSASLSMILAKAKSLPRPDINCKPFSCSFCPKSFHSAADLKRHQRIHTGEKPFGCGVCGKRFSLRGNLITHERAHSGSKPFICQHCGRAFTHSSNLNAHRRVHTGERPFHCSLCGETFAWQHPFKRHLRLHCQNVVV